MEFFEHHQIDDFGADCDDDRDAVDDGNLDVAVNRPGEDCGCKPSTGECYSTYSSPAGEVTFGRSPGEQCDKGCDYLHCTDYTEIGL